MSVTRLALFAVLTACSLSSVLAFSWVENFEGEISPYWAAASGSGGFVGVVDDGTGNHVLKIETDGPGWAMASVWAQAFNGLDATQEVTFTARFRLLAPSDEFVVVASSFAGGIMNGTEYWYTEPNGKLFDMPLNQWVSLKYQFIPEGGTTHKIWLNKEYLGEFANYEAGIPEYVAFMLGDPDDEGGAYGAAMWDDLTVTGADYVPEPGSIVTLASALLSCTITLRLRKR